MENIENKQNTGDKKMEIKDQNEINVRAYNTTENLYDFWQAGGKWSMDQYISEMKKRGDL